MEFHLQRLLEQRWPPGCGKPYLTSWDPNHPERLEELLDANTFQLIVLAAKVGDWKYW